MKRGIIAIIIAFAACILFYGQVDYKSKGLSYAANGNYAEAEKQFNAAKAVLQSKKVNQNAPEFIDIEKKISYAKQCQTFSAQAEQALNKLTDSALQDAFAQCNSESEADQVQESLLATLEKAKNALNNIKAKFSNDKVAKAKLDKCTDIQNIINGFRDNFSEVQAWKQALAANTMPAYEEFLRTYPNGNYSSAAKEKVTEFKDMLAWAEASNSGNYESYLQYIKSYPNGVYAEVAKKYVNEMGDEMCWSANNEIGTTDSYKDYISRYPSGKYITYAKQRLAKCQERDYWEELSAKNTVASYKSYLSKYPNGSYAAAAQNGIDKIGEASAWEKAEQENTIAGYQAYLNASKKKAFKKEAEERIAQIKHEQEVSEDNDRWAKIVNSKSSSDFNSYITSPNYKGHMDEAKTKYNIYRAREYTLDEANAPEIIRAYNQALNYSALEPEDKYRLDKAKEIVSYQSFTRNRDIESALSYLKNFPLGEHSLDVSDAVATMKADQMDMNVTDSEYQDAMAFAKSKETRAYVQKIFNQKQAEYKKYARSLKREPFHALLALDGMFYSMNAVSAFDIAPVISLGGRSNRVNLELGYYIQSGYAVARPRINLVKKNPMTPTDFSQTWSGKQYSKFTLFVAPEFAYYVHPLTNELSAVLDEIIAPEATVFDSWKEKSIPLEYYPGIDYGARAGIGIGMFDFFAGYRIVSQSVYFGLTWNFSRK